MNNKVSVFEDYGPLQNGCLYKLVKEGHDFYTLRCRGTNVQIPKNIVDFYPQSYKKPEIELEEEDFINYLDECYMDGV